MQKSAALTVVSFLNTTKYPPSLLFLLMTLGPAMLLLRALDSRTPRFLRRAGIIGKVPMFYFALHIPLIHLLALIVCYARYGHVYWMFQSPDLARLSLHPATGVGILVARDLPGLGSGGGDAVSTLPLVCCAETAPPRLVAEVIFEAGEEGRT